MKLDVDSGKGIQIKRRGATKFVGHRSRKAIAGIASAIATFALLPGMAAATSVDSTATGTDGSDAFTAMLEIDDATTPGSLVFSLSILGDNSNIKIKGFGSGLIDTANLADPSAVGADVKTSFFNHGQQIPGQPQIDPSCTTCDMVVMFNKPAKGATDKSVCFTVSSLTQQPVTLADFSNQDIAVLLQVKGAWNVRGAQKGFFFHDKKMMILEGKVGVSSVVPEPTTAVMLLLGPAGLSFGERRTRVG